MPNYNNKYSGMSLRERNDLKQTDSLTRLFSLSPSYFEVDKYNDDNSITSNFPIQLFNHNTITNSYKKFITHPNHDLMYGSIIKESDEYYMVYTIKEMNHVNFEGEMRECNTSIKWEQNGRIVEQLAYTDKFNVSSDDDKNINLLSGTTKLYLPNNINTIKIYENQRFIIGNTKLNVYTVDAIDDFSKSGMLIITLKIDEFSDEDDKVNKIAYNQSNIVANLFNSTVDDSYYIVSPEILKIRYEEIVDVNVIHYNNVDTVIATNFTYTITDIISTDYELTMVDNNNVTIKNNNFPNSGKLNIKNEDNGETIQVNISFIGLW
jgi:hypothetical protein